MPHAGDAELKAALELSTKPSQDFHFVTRCFFLASRAVTLGIAAELHHTVGMDHRPHRAAAQVGWDHDLTRAMLAEVVAREAALAASDSVFAAGLSFVDSGPPSTGGKFDLNALRAVLRAAAIRWGTKALQTPAMANSSGTLRDSMFARVFQLYSVSLPCATVSQCHTCKHARICPKAEPLASCKTLVDPAT